METINQTETDLEINFQALSGIPNICRDCAKSASEAMAFNDFSRRAAH
jgi:hypothetical protein